MRGADGLAQPGSRAVPSRFGGDQGARVALEERHVGAEAADGDLDGEGAPAGHRGQRTADQRGLAVSARRNEEDLLRGREILHQAVELDDAIHEGAGRYDLAVDEGIIHYGIRRSGYVIARNGEPPLQTRP